jgi:hypothetical protein
MDPDIHCLVDILYKTGTCGYFVYHGLPCKHYFAAVENEKAFGDARQLAAMVLSTPIPGDVRRPASTLQDPFAASNNDPLAFLPAAKKDVAAFPNLRQFHVDAKAGGAASVPGPAAARQPHHGGKRRKAGARKQVFEREIPTLLRIFPWHPTARLWRTVTLLYPSPYL